MNLQVLLVVCIAAVSVKVTAQRSLHQHFQDFEELVPTDEVKELVSTYVDTNADVQAALEFLHSDEFKFQYKKILGLTVVKGVVDYLNEAGVQIVEFLNKFADLFELEHYTPAPAPETLNDDDDTQSFSEGDGVAAMVQDLLNVLPQEKSKALFEEKLENSTEFKEFVDKLRTKKFKTLIFYATNSMKLEKHLKVLRDNHVDVKHVFTLVRAFFGYSYNL